MKTAILEALPSDGTRRPVFRGPGFQATPQPASAEQPISHYELQFIDEYGDIQRTKLAPDETAHAFRPDYRGRMPDAAINIAAFVRTERWTNQKMMLIRMTPDY